MGTTGNGAVIWEGEKYRAIVYGLTSKAVGLDIEIRSTRIKERWMSRPVENKYGKIFRGYIDPKKVLFWYVQDSIPEAVAKCVAAAQELDREHKERVSSRKTVKSVLKSAIEVQQIVSDL